jgi:hypothetical protein
MIEDAQVRERTENAGIQRGRIEFLVVNTAATAFKLLLAVKPRNLTRTLNLSVGGFVAAAEQASKFIDGGSRVLMISGIDSMRHYPAMACSEQPRLRWKLWCATSHSGWTALNHGQRG